MKRFDDPIIITGQRAQNEADGIDVFDSSYRYEDYLERLMREDCKAEMASQDFDRKHRYGV